MAHINSADDSKKINANNTVSKPGLIPADSPLLAWRQEREDLGVKLNEQVRTGQEINYLPESKERDLDDSIDPDNADAIKKELMEIWQKEFPQAYQRRYANPVLQLYNNILLKLPEALLDQAITENGTERQLRKEFRNIIQKFEDAAADNDMDLDEGLFILEKKQWKKPVKPEHQTANRFLNDRKIKPTDKTMLSLNLQQIEAAAEAQFREQFEGFFTDDFDEDQLDFIRLHEIPFFREFYLNLAILSNQDQGALARDYSQFLDNALSSTLK